MDEQEKTTVQRDLELEEQWSVNYREQLAGVPGDTPQQQIDWLLERAGVAREGALDDG